MNGRIVFYLYITVRLLNHHTSPSIEDFLMLRTTDSFVYSSSDTSFGMFTI